MTQASDLPGRHVMAQLDVLRREYPGYEIWVTGLPYGRGWLWQARGTRAFIMSDNFDRFVGWLS